MPACPPPGLLGVCLFLTNPLPSTDCVFYNVFPIGTLPQRDRGTDHSPAGDHPIPRQHGTAQLTDYQSSEPSGRCRKREGRSVTTGHSPLYHHSGPGAEGTGFRGTERPAGAGQIHRSDRSARSSGTA